MVSRFNCSDLVILPKCKACELTTNEKLQNLPHKCRHENKSEVIYYQQLCEKCSTRSYSILWMFSHQMKHNQINKVSFKTNFKDDSEFSRDQYASGLSHRSKINLTSDDKLSWYECEKCTWKTKYLRSLKKHLRSKHSTRKELQCNECDYQTHLMNSFKRHIIDKHTSDHLINWYNCNNCSHRAKHKYSLIRHIKSEHTPDNQLIWFKCDICDFKTKTRFHLKNHLIVKHSTEKLSLKYSCNICVFKTKQQRYLTRHIKRMHASGDQKNNLTCHVCNARFKQSSSLKRHLVSYHSTETSCFDCGYKANDFASLRRHWKEHSKVERRFECDKCMYDTDQKSHFQKHMITRHDIIC